MEKACVIMSVYKSDSASSLYKSLESMVNQTYNNFDIYICQDGIVPDDVEDVLNQFINQCKCIHLVKNEKNMGLAKSLNRLISHVLTNKDVRYLVRMDADDISHLDRISKQVEYMEQHGLHVCGSYCREFGASYALAEKKVPIYHHEILNQAVANCPFIHPTVVFERSVFESGIRYPEQTTFTEDMALWFLLIKAGYSLGNIPVVLLDYRLNEETVSRRLGWGKGYSEFCLRIRFIISNRSFKLLDLLKIFARLPFHILPVGIAKFLYRHAR